MNYRIIKKITGKDGKIKKENVFCIAKEKKNEKKTKATFWGL